jgi:phosphoribosyl 1,2-cyclic phosphate phosphodiesterase
MKTKFIILGSGSSVGVPRIDGVWGKCDLNNIKNHRTRCSAIVIKGSNYILIDTSPDIKTQLLSNGIKNISSVLFTHEHADQTNGLFELRPFFWKSKKKINVYGNKNTIKQLKKAHSYLFKKTTNYPAIVNSNFVKPKFSLGKAKEKIFFKALKVKHGEINSIAYIFEKTAYITDTNDLSIVKMNEFKKLNYLILDCLKFKKHYSHFNLDDALYVHRELKPNKTILTNLHYDLDYNYLLKNLPDNVLPAYDNFEINL